MSYKVSVTAQEEEVPATDDYSLKIITQHTALVQRPRRNQK